MARGYPKFLYEHVTGTKSDGEFVMHLLKPRALFLVEHDGNGSVELILMDKEEPEGIEAVKNRAKEWYIFTHLIHMKK